MFIIQGGKKLKSAILCSYPAKKNVNDINKGFIPSTVISSVTYKPDYMGKKNAKPLPIPEGNMKYIHAFLNICKEKSIPVILLELPSPNSWSYGKHNFVKRIAEKENVPFIDLNTDESGYNVNFSRDFRDNGNHLNIYGAENTTTWIGKYVSETYGELISDKRNDSAYKSWRKVVEHFKKYTAV